MQITQIEDLHADGGWRIFSFVKMTTDTGLVGWSEFSEYAWSPGLTEVIRKMGKTLIGRDPTAFAKIAADLRASTRLAPGGIADQAAAALEHACIDIAAKAAGVPVSTLFGGPLREDLPLYWSHCGSFRASQAGIFENELGLPPLRVVEDFTRIGQEARARGYGAVKTNPVLFDRERPRMLSTRFKAADVDHSRNIPPAIIAGIVDQLSALREGLGPDIGIMLDVNFTFSAESLRKLVYALDPLAMTWLETDVHDPAALALVRRSGRTPIASLETIYGVKNYLPYLQAGSADVCIVDVVWNGLVESLHVAAAAQALETNVAPHNFYSHLATMISAHFCALVPNFRIMEYEGDDVPWKDDLFTHPPQVADGHMRLPTRPGWGTDVNEDAVRAHPPR